MSLRTSLRDTLVAGVPSVSNRVYPLIMPQDTQKNSIVYSIVGDLENTGLCGVKVTSDVTAQVDIFAKTYADSISLKDDAVTALRGAFYVADLTTFEMYEDITLKYRQIISFTLKSYVDK